MSHGAEAAVSRSAGRESDRWVGAGLLSLLVALGLWLRLRNLGDLGLIVDEGIQALAVRGILEHGIPLLDSGEIYRRDLGFLYLQAAVAGLFEPGPFWLRLPAAVFGAAVVVPVYRLGEQLFDRRVGLLAATLMTFSVWNIELSRYARPYTALQLMYLVSLLCFYRGFMLGERRYRPWFLVAAWLTFSTHHLSLALVSSFLLPLPLAARSRREKAILGLWAAATLAVWGVHRQLMRWLTAGGAEAVAVGAASSPPDLVARLRALVGLPGFVGPDLRPFAEAVRQQPLLVAGLGVVVAATSAYLAHRAVSGDGPRRCLVALAAAWAALFHQFGLALILLAGSLALDRRDAAERPLRAAALTVLICLASWLSWLLLGLALTGKQVVLALFGFPDLIHYFLYWFVVGWPLMAGVVAVGAVLLMARFRRDPADPVPLFLVGGVCVPAVVTSCFRAYSEIRYTFHLYPLLVLIFCAVAVWAWAGLARRWPVESPWTRRSAAALAVAVTLLLSQDAWPVAASAVADRTYQSSRDPVRSVINWRPYAGFHQDHEGPSRFVSSHRRPGDEVLALGAVHMIGNYHYYARGVDYAVVPAETPDYYAAVRAGSLVNYVTGSELVAGRAGVESLVARYAGRLWVLGDRNLLIPDNEFYDEPLKAYLRQLTIDPDYLARDGQTFAKRILVRSVPERGPAAGGDG